MLIYNLSLMYVGCRATLTVGINSSLLVCHSPGSTLLVLWSHPTFCMLFKPLLLLPKSCIDPPYTTLCHMCTELSFSSAWIR